ncbi:hypothetical protein SETIT_6G026300v2 [Setaria italica]|uniref:Uncharacterized protein n=1 Tax=Setaria italica TaxID=4555 RepID=A0A368RHK3_SETIT|nr:hypothetical protein SETIT_6G026300v2 [Setaria italica]
MPLLASPRARTRLEAATSKRCDSVLQGLRRRRSTAGQREEDQVEAAGGGADRGRAPAHRGRGLVRRQVPLGAREAEQAEAAGGLHKNCEVSTLGL